MNRVAFIFSHAPHGSSAGREGLDAALATAALSDDIALFFVGDGVMQLNMGQQPDIILSRNYIATFGVLALYDIENCYLCMESLLTRGLTVEMPRVVDAKVLDAAALRQKLSGYDRIISF